MSILSIEIFNFYLSIVIFNVIWWLLSIYSKFYIYLLKYWISIYLLKLMTFYLRKFDIYLWKYFMTIYQSVRIWNIRYLSIYWIIWCLYIYLYNGVHAFWCVFELSYFYVSFNVFDAYILRLIVYLSIEALHIYILKFFKSIYLSIQVFDGYLSI